jgi:hypothetical protein
MEAQEAKLALAEKRRLAQETRKQEIEAAKRKEEEHARNYANAQKLKRGEEARQKAWEEHLAAQSLRQSNDKDLEARNATWQEKKRVDREAKATTQHLTRSPGKHPCLIISKGLLLAVTMPLLLMSNSSA